MKPQQMNMRMNADVKAQLDAIRMHHAANGSFRSFRQIIEDLIKREFKRLKIEAKK